MSISHSAFVGNTGNVNTGNVMYVFHGMAASIDYSKFIKNIGSQSILVIFNTIIASITHNEFVNNVVESLENQPPDVVVLDGVMITIHLNEFIKNIAGAYGSLMLILYHTSPDNSAEYDVLIYSDCRPGLNPSLSSSRCIQCSENWHQDLIGIVTFASIAGIALVIFMLALNTTVAVGTLNGILFYANIVAANADTYFLPFTTPDFVTVFISWLNLDISFDICFRGLIFTDIHRDEVYKALLQLIFPAYIISLVFIVIVASHYSSKFAKLIGKGNPVAVLATMILLSYARFFTVILESVLLLYEQPAFGSRNLDITRLEDDLETVNSVASGFELRENAVRFKAIVYFLLILSILILLSGVIYTALVFFWQWLLRYQDKVIFRWVRYQKLHHFLEPYHAPYTAKHRYWTGLLLFVRVLLYLISILNFSRDPRVDLMCVILVVGGLILLKGMSANRVYKNWPLDIMETAIYFNLVAFSALTWYNLDFGGNQVAVVYTSVTIIFVLLLGVFVYHILCYTRLYKWSVVENGFKWVSSKMKQQKESPNDALGDLIVHQLAADDQELPVVTHTELEIRLPSPTQSQEEQI